MREFWWNFRRAINRFYCAIPFFGDIRRIAQALELQNSYQPVRTPMSLVNPPTPAEMKDATISYSDKATRDRQEVANLLKKHSPTNSWVRDLYNDLERTSPTHADRQADDRHD